MQVCGRLDEFDRRGAKVIAVSFVRPERLRPYLERHPWPIQVLADPDRAAYQAFGLERASWLKLLRPRVIWRYFGIMLRGRPPEMAQEDVHQLGGDFVLDRDGRVLFEYRSSDPVDRPDVSVLLKTLD